MSNASPHYPAHLIDVVHLADGERIVLRPVLPQDAPLLQDFVRGLSREARHFRFMRGLAELPQGLLERLTRIDYETHQALLAIAVENDEETVVGEARYVEDDDPASAELAVSIADRWQGKGIASLLIERLARDAAAHGYAHLVGHTLRDNDRMLHIARKAGMAVLNNAGDPTTLRLSRDLRARPEDSTALRDALIVA